MTVTCGTTFRVYKTQQGCSLLKMTVNLASSKYFQLAFTSAKASPCMCPVTPVRECEVLFQQIWSTLLSVISAWHLVLGYSCCSTVLLDCNVLCFHWQPSCSDAVLIMHFCFTESQSLFVAVNVSPGCCGYRMYVLRPVSTLYSTPSCLPLCWLISVESPKQA